MATIKPSFGHERYLGYVHDVRQPANRKVPLGGLTTTCEVSWLGSPVLSTGVIGVFVRLWKRLPEQSCRPHAGIQCLTPGPGMGIESMNRVANMMRTFRPS